MEELIHLTNNTNLPLSLNQRRLWIVSQVDKFNPAYNIQLTYNLEGEIDFKLLLKSITILFDKQHTVFSVFMQRDGIPYIEMIKRPVCVEQIDFSDYPADLRRESILSFAGENSKKHFDIETGPLYRLYLLKENSNSYFFSATFHHIIFDGWSVKVFAEELSRIYTNLCQGIDEKSEQLKYHSYDFAACEEKSRFCEEDKISLDFWKENLKDCPVELKFPYDYTRKNFSSGFAVREPFIISDLNAKRLTGLSKEANSTLFQTMLSVLSLFIQKYTGENDFCIGVPVSTRRSLPAFRIFGLFVNTAVVRLKYNGGNKFIDHIHYVAETVKKAILHSKFPFEKIVEAVNPERVPGINPFFQVSLSWVYNLSKPIKLGDITGRWTPPDKGVTPFDITFYMWENGSIIEGEIECSADLLKVETIVNLRDKFLTLISNILENRDFNLDSLSLISAEEIKRINGFNETKSYYPKDKTIVQLFEDQVSLFADKTAVVFKEVSVTYRQLNERANQLARTLRHMGIKENSPIGMLTDKSAEMIIGILGILKAGGTYLPIDPDYPALRIALILKESGCKVLLTQSKFIGVETDGIKVLDLNSQETYNKNTENVANINSSSDLAYIVFTSGTTGVPKGSMIQHYSVVRLVRNVNYMDLTSEDRIMYTSAIVFDVSTFEIWGALLNGMTLYVVEKETILDASALGKELTKNNITILHLTSALFTQLAELRTDIFRGLKYLLVGGDVLSVPHINKVRRDNPELKVINCYGPSENTTYSTTYLIEKDFDQNIPIGKPISNSTVYIFDKHLNYQPIGVIGELYVGGDGVSKGYLNKDDLNKTCFIDHPLIPGERLYKTGDYGRWLPDGNIEFHGRADNQFKIRGFRVELEEIESVISAIDSVIETVIKPIKDDKGGCRLIAFLNVAESFTMNAKEINRLVKKKLPAYMVPHAYKFMQGFPRTINGKIDRKALIPDLKELIYRDRTDERNLSPTEKIILNIWREALNISDISTTDSFFEVGGNSLLAISVFSKIESAFNIEVGLRVFFDSPRIKDLAETIDIELLKKGASHPGEKKSKSEYKIIEGEI